MSKNFKSHIIVDGDIDAASFNGVDLKTDGSTTQFLNGEGNYTTPSGGGDVIKVGTPNSNRLAMWTGDGTLAHVQDLAWIQGDSTMYISGTINATNITSQGFSTVGEASGGDLVANFGDYNNENNSTQIVITDSTSTIIIGDPYDLNNGMKIEVLNSSGHIYLGDTTGINNGTYIDINEASAQFDVFAQDTFINGNLNVSGSTATFGTTAISSNNKLISPYLIKSITIESPSASEDISMFYIDRNMTISKIIVVLKGSSTPSVTWTIRHSDDRNGVGKEVVTAGTTTTNTTTGDIITTFNDATIPSNSFIWLETTAQSGTVAEMNITLVLSNDI